MCSLEVTIENGNKYGEEKSKDRGQEMEMRREISWAPIFPKTVVHANGDLLTKSGTMIVDGANEVASLVAR